MHHCDDSDDAELWGEGAMLEDRQGERAMSVRGEDRGRVCVSVGPFILSGKTISLCNDVQFAMTSL